VGSPARVEILHMQGIIVVSAACGAGVRFRFLFASFYANPILASPSTHPEEHTVVKCDAGIFTWGGNAFGQV
jgi:hypothetical protein